MKIELTFRPLGGLEGDKVMESDEHLGPVKVPPPLIYLAAQTLVSKQTVNSISMNKY